MSLRPVAERHEIEAALLEVGKQADEDIDLAAAALLLAALDRPRVSLDRYHHHLSLLARDTADLAHRNGAAGSLDSRIEALNQVFCERYEYAGDTRTYDALQNANLMRVIDRRRGLPVALSILYMHAGLAQGWTIEGVNFPGHFLIALSLGAERVILDPFNQGHRLTTADLRRLLKTMLGEQAELSLDHTRGIARREILLRLRNNIKVRLLDDGQHERALEVLDSMLLVAPRQAIFWREAGLLHAHLENYRAAIMATENFLDLSDNARSCHEAAGFLQELKTKLN